MLILVVCPCLIGMCVEGGGGGGGGGGVCMCVCVFMCVKAIIVMPTSC